MATSIHEHCHMGYLLDVEWFLNNGCTVKDLDKVRHSTQAAVAAAAALTPVSMLAVLAPSAALGHAGRTRACSQGAAAARIACGRAGQCV